MPEHIEVETTELQDTIEELHDERAQLDEERKRAKWVGYIGLSTAILAVVAAVAALQSSSLINDALINQVKASDTWSEYQASRQKDHLYTITLNGLLDANASNRALVAAMRKPVEAKPAAGSAANAAPSFVPKSIAQRASQYRAKIADEASKERARFAKATKLEDESKAQIEKQRHFELAVTLIQVAIALGAISALTRVRPVWYLSLLAGLIGIVLFVSGFTA